MELEVLRSQLQLETSARKEHEIQCASKTRQLWQMREQHEHEVRRLQDQLSVVRASLLQHLAHKAALELKVRQQQHINGASTAAAAANKLKLAVGADAADGDYAAGRLQDDVQEVADGSPKRRKPVQLDQADRPLMAASPCTVLQRTEADDNAAIDNNTSPASAADAADATEAEQLANALTGEGVLSAQVTAAAAAAAAPQQDAAGELDSYGQTVGVSASSAAVLLTAAAKLQRLVEQLTQREPGAAADLSLLQWQLTAAFGSMTGAPSRNGDEHLPLQNERHSSSLEAADSPAAGHGVVSAVVAEASSSSSSSIMPQDTPTTPAGSVKRLPAGTHPLAEEAAAAAAGHPAQHSAAEVAAAARLFSGAATTLQAPSIDWYYLEEGGSVRGPHDAALMIRWFCSFFLEEHLPVAGVLQQADGSSSQPPAAAFQQLHHLLQLVQQGEMYMPHNAVTVCRASASQLLLAMPASPPPRHLIRAQQHQQQQQQQQQDMLESLLSPRCQAGLPDEETGSIELGTGGEPALPTSTLSSEPAATPTGRHAVATSNTSGSTHTWGSGAGFTPSQQQQQQQQWEVQGFGASSSSGASTLSMHQQMAARLRDAARLEASPMCSAVASPVVGHSSSGSSSMRQAPGSLAFAARTAIAGNSSNSSDAGRLKSSGGGWAIQAVQDALGSVGSAVEGLAMQVAEGLDSLDSMANAAADVPAVDSVDGGAAGIAAEGSNSALDFVSDFPQLFPAALMNDVVQQRHSAAGVAVAQQQQQQQQEAAASRSTGGNRSSKDTAPSLVEGQAEQPGLTAAVSDMSEFAAEAVRHVRSVVAAAQLPGVWRVESLHQMLRAVSPEPASNTATGPSKR